MTDFIAELLKKKKKTHPVDRPKEQWWIFHVDAPKVSGSGVGLVL